MLGCERLAPDGEQLHPLLAVTPPEGIDEAAVRSALLLDHGIEISGGLGPLAGKLWRIGVMGAGARREPQEQLVSALCDAARRRLGRAARRARRGLARVTAAASADRAPRAVSLDPARFADLLAGYCLDVQPGQEVLVRSTTLAAPLLLECQRAILERDAWPLLRVEIPGATAAHYRHAQDRHLDTFSEVAYAEAKKAHAQLAIQAPENTRALAGIDPARLARAARARQPLREQTMQRALVLDALADARPAPSRPA